MAAAKKYHSRGFLNSDKGIAAFEAKVEFYHAEHSYANFTITDCNRTINLDFDYEDADSKKRRIEKLDTIIEQLQKFKEQL